MNTFVNLWWLWLLICIVGYAITGISFSKGWKNPRQMGVGWFVIGGLTGSAGFLCLIGVFIIKVIDRMPH